MTVVAINYLRKRELRLVVVAVPTTGTRRPKMNRSVRILMINCSRMIGKRGGVTMSRGCCHLPKDKEPSPNT